MSQFSGLEGYDPSGSSDESRRAHLYDDVDTSPEAHHHTLGLGPDQAVSYPMAKDQFDGRYSTLTHTHPELAGDNLIVNGDAASGDAYWTRTTVNASSTISANRFITQLAANPSSCVWKSEKFTPVVNETCTGSITYQANATTVTVKVDVLWNDTGATPDIGDGVSTTVTLVNTTVDAVSQDDVSVFSWVVPATCAAARLFVTIGNGTITSGFPVSVIHDNVQLISKLREVSPLYVGVTDPQEMEGPLTITAGSPLILPTTDPEAEVLVNVDGTGTVGWGAAAAPMAVGDTAPTNPDVGDLWRDTTVVDADPFFVVYAPSIGNGTQGITNNNTWTPWSGAATLALDIPCEGILEIDFSCYMSQVTTGSIIQYRPEIKASTGLTATKQSGAGNDSQFARWVNAGSTVTNHLGFGKAMWEITAVGSGGGSIELEHQGLAGASAASIVFAYPRMYVKFWPYMNRRTLALT